MSSKALSNPTERTIEDPILKLGYEGMFQRCYPLTNKPGECFTPERAFFMEAEREFMEIPDELRFENIVDSIPDIHRERIGALWKKAVRSQEKWRKAIRKLLYVWAQAPKIIDPVANKEMTTTAINIQAQFRNATAAVISNFANIKKTIVQRVLRAIEINRKTSANWWDKPLSEFEQWQISEADSRESVYRKDKNYLAALRLYNELLLETPREQGELRTQKAGAEEIWGAQRPPVLPLDHRLRGEILIRLRVLCAIDGLRQGVSYAKAAHHEQQEKRVRDAEGVPYIFHPAEAAGSIFQDVIPFLVVNDEIPGHFAMPVELLVLAALHDLAEDTRLTSEYIIHQFVKPRANPADSSLNQLIISGFDVPDEKFKKRYGLLKERQLTHLAKALEALSKDEPVNERQLKYALHQNIFGEERTLHVLRAQSAIKPEANDESPALPAGRREPNATMKHIPLPSQKEIAENLGSDQDFFQKIERQLIYSSSFLERKEDNPVYYMTILVKMADTSHNLATQRKLGLQRRCKKLFPTTLRLLPWLLFEHDHQRFPLFNLLPRLFEETLNEYHALEADLLKYETKELNKASSQEGDKIIQRYKWIYDEIQNHLGLLGNWANHPALQRQELPERFRPIDERAKMAG